MSLYPNGTLRSINTEVQDKAGTIVPSVLELTSSIVDTARKLSSKGDTLCNPRARQAMDQREKLWGQITGLKALVTEISARDPLTDDDKKQLQQANENLKIKNGALAEASEQSSYKQSFRWMPSNGTRAKSLKMNAQGKRKLFSNEEKVPALFRCIQATLKCQERSVDTKSKSNPGMHLIYRVPAPATLELAYCGEETIVARKDVDLPQAGVHMALPLINTAFDKTNLVAEFDENGALTEFQFVTGARLEGLAQALATTAKTANEILEARKGRELKKVQTKTELLKAKAELIKAERDLQALEDVGRAQPSP